MSRTEYSGATSPPVLISVHDLMPGTMPAVRRTLQRLEQLKLSPVTLLVVPGRGWDRAGLAELRALQLDGYRLAGHGWLHHAERLGGLYHRLHSLFLSRRVAEHLALDELGVIALVQRCFAWFGDHGLDTPTLYVPPAWALGAVSKERLRDACPFRLYEIFSGVVDAATSQTRSLPLLGYEADNALRGIVLRGWNQWHRFRAQRSGDPLRIGIHPYDIDLGLSADLARDLEQPMQPIAYDALLESPAQPAAVRT
jgi:predicted deacetylase